MGRSRRSVTRRPAIPCLSECPLGTFRNSQDRPYRGRLEKPLPTERVTCGTEKLPLWWTVSDGQRVMGASGSVLCLGRLNDEQAKAIVFKNAEGPPDYTLTADDHHPMAQERQNPLASWKAGFLLLAKSANPKCNYYYYYYYLIKFIVHTEP